MENPRNGGRHCTDQKQRREKRRHSGPSIPLRLMLTDCPRKSSVCAVSPAAVPLARLETPMHRLAVSVLLFTLSIPTAYAQDALTRDQRIADLVQLASQYAKNYGPYEWKRDVQGFDLMRLTPWLQRIQHSEDLDFQEALIEYVASLNDAHDTIAFPTTFSASLPMTVDIYDGKVLIDSINRTRLPIAEFPFVIGDELLFLDGQSVQTLIQSFRKYAIAANQRSTDRIA